MNILSEVIDNADCIVSYIYRNGCVSSLSSIDENYKKITHISYYRFPDDWTGNQYYVRYEIWFDTTYSCRYSCPSGFRQKYDPSEHPYWPMINPKSAFNRYYRL